MSNHQFAFNVAKALDNPTRFKILTALSKQDFTVNDLAKTVGVSQSAASQHISILKNAELIVGTKTGQHISYSLNRRYLINGFKEMVRLLEESK